MTGYVVADKPELKMKEYELYRSYYCGVCRSIGKRYGQLQRMVLSYDSAFLAILLFALSAEKENISFEHCMIHPVKRKNICTDNPAIDYAADIMLILAYKNIVDDINDEGSFWMHFPELALRGTYNRLSKQYPELCSFIEDKLDELTELEKSKSGSLDMTSDTFARIMEAAASGRVSADGGWKEFFSDESGEAVKLSEMDRTVLGNLGFHLGKWMYVIDAVDDLEKDIEEGSYNPLIYRFEYDRNGETPEEFRERTLPQMEFLLFHYLGEMSKAYDLLDVKKNRGIIENIIFMGLHRKTEEVLKKGKGKNEGSI